VRSSEGAEQVVLGTHLMASPGFTVVDGAPLPAVEPFGLLDGLPASVLEAACEWERHLVEVETGLPPDPLPGASPRPGFDPVCTTVVERAAARPPSWE
jgi:putative transposase